MNQNEQQELVFPPFIFGMHDPGDWRDIFNQADKKGWVMFNQPMDDDNLVSRGNPELAEWAEQGFGVLVRLVNASLKTKHGSIPIPEQHGQFAERCAQFVNNSPGCRVWFIGNEMNISWHWPTPPNDIQPQKITPSQYADCFRQVYKTIKSIQPEAWVIPSGLNPLQQPGTQYQDALKWFQAMLEELDALDGFDLHTYFPLMHQQNLHQAYTYTQFLDLVPPRHRNLPVFITEATPPDIWPEKSDGWLQRTYANINRWNQNPDQQTIYALLPYRWEDKDKKDIWALRHKPSYHDDLRQALQHDYRWQFPSESGKDEEIPDMPLDEEPSNYLQSTQVEDVIDASDLSEAQTMSETNLESLPIEEIPTESPTPEEKETPPPAPSTSTPATAVSPVISSINFIPYQPTSPPPQDNTVTIEVNAEDVRLHYGEKRFYSLNLLADEAYQEQLQQAREEGTPASYGRLLFQAIINDTLKPNSLAQSTAHGYTLAQAQTEGKLRWELIFHAYAEYEWECLRDNQQHLAIREDAPLYRRLDTSTERGLIEAKPLKILVAICNPTNLNAPYPLAPEIEQLHRLQVDQQRFIIEEGLERLRLAGLAEYEILDNEHKNGRSSPGITLNLLREKLQEGYHILHLLTHGLYAPDHTHEYKYHLVMETAKGQRRLEAAERFNQTILGDKLRLVVLAACQSATPGAKQMLRGMGAHLIKEGVPAVISMRGNVPIETVQLFTQKFYDDLARSGRIDMALAATRGDIYQPNQQSWDWSIPVLMMSTDNGQLFQVNEQQAYEKLSRLEPDIKSYPELPGGNPRPQQMAQALTAQARALGVPSHLTTLFQMMSAPAVFSPPPTPKSKPRTPKQDRALMSAQLSDTFEFKADELKNYVENSSQLQLPPYVYAQTASALNAGKHVIFIGPPGTGKTLLAHDICTYAKTHPSREKSMTTGYILTTATADWTTFDTVGGYVPTPEGALEFEPGIFLRAVRTGQWLVIDEINRAEIDKAFGELFTLLSKQQVDLPYKVGEERLRILPPAEGANWIGEGRGSYDYVMHPNWRILATMNVYDKSYLFQMSFAFMRRFAFVDVDLPTFEVYKALRQRWINKSPLQTAPTTYKDTFEKLLDFLFYLENNLMKQRALGPAIAKDMIYYIGDRYKHATANEQTKEQLPELLAEAFLLYAVPQFDALDQVEIHGIHDYVGQLLGYAAVNKGVLARIKSLYPHVREWPPQPTIGQLALPLQTSPPTEEGHAA